MTPHSTSLLESQDQRDLLAQQEAAHSVDVAALVTYFLTEHFAVIDGPARAFYETVDGIIDHGEDDIDQRPPNAVIERGMYMVYGLGVTDEGANGVPFDDHARVLWAEFQKFLVETRDQCGSSLTYVQRSPPQYSIAEYEVFDLEGPGYSTNTFTKMRAQAVQAHTTCKDEFSAAQAHAVDDFALDSTTGLWRRVLSRHNKSKIKIRGHFRGIPSTVKHPFVLLEGCEVMNVAMPLEAFDSHKILDELGREVKPLPVGA